MASDADLLPRPPLPAKHTHNHRVIILVSHIHTQVRILHNTHTHTHTHDSVDSAYIDMLQFHVKPRNAYDLRYSACLNNSPPLPPLSFPSGPLVMLLYCEHWNAQTFMLNRGTLTAIQVTMVMKMNTKFHYTSSPTPT